jgi:adenylate cyclase
MAPVEQASRLESRPEAAQVREQLERIVASARFAGAPRLVTFLRFIVEEALAGRAKALKQYTIGTLAFGLDSGFDPKSDPFVRILGGRLRRALTDYYRDHSGDDPVRIDVALGSYVPEFRWVVGENVVAARHDDRPVTSGSLPTIVVFPFVNLSRDPAQNYLAHGLGEELSLALCQFDNVRVVAHYSAMSPEHGEHDLAEIGKDLGATFVISGSLRSEGSKVRVNVRLDRTDTRERLWAHRFERTLTAQSLFALEDDIVRTIVARVADEYGVIPRTLGSFVRSKPPSQLSTYEAVLRNHHYMMTFDDHDATRRALERAIESEPDFAPGWAMLAQVHMDTHTFGMPGVDDALGRARHCAARAMTLDPNCQFAHYAAAFVALNEGDGDGVIRAAERMVQLNRNAAFMVGSAGFFMALAGAFEQGLILLEESMALNPHFPPWFRVAYYLDHYRRSEDEAALQQANAFALPDFFWSPLLRAAALGQLGRQDEACAAYHELLRLKPDFPARAREYVAFFVLVDELVDRLLEGLQRAEPVSRAPHLAPARCGAGMV